MSLIYMVWLDKHNIYTVRSFFCPHDLTMAVEDAVPLIVTFIMIKSYEKCVVENVLEM